MLYYMYAKWSYNVYIVMYTMLNHQFVCKDFCVIGLTVSIQGLVKWKLAKQSQWISIFVYHIHILLPSLKLILNTITFYQTVINSIFFKWYKQYSITCITKIDIALNPFNLKLNIFNLTENLFDRYWWVCRPSMLLAVRLPRPR